MITPIFSPEGNHHADAKLENGAQRSGANVFARPDWKQGIGELKVMVRLYSS
jgi:hypothetical protein